jgi:predicted lysophospholipase L1 biosynthesis ABC-type transport system permease subunit
MGIAIVAGRDFDARDTLAGEQVAIANMAFRQRFAPGRDIVGHRVMLSTPLRLVGVVQDVPAQSLRELPEPRLYLPLAQLPRSQVGWRSMTLVIRGPNDGPPAAMVREQIRAAGPGLLVDEVATMEERLAAALRAERDSAKVFGFFAVVALILAGVGVYGVASYAVAQRTKEIGVRLALGAGRSDINMLVLTGALGPTLLGVGWGLLATVGVGPLLATMLYGVAPLDPTTFVVSAIALVGVALGATYLPARRAARVNPVEALRAE